MSFPLDEDTLPRDEYEELFLQRLPGGRSMRRIFGPGVASAYKYQEALLDMALEMGADADSMVPPRLFSVDCDGAERAVEDDVGTGVAMAIGATGPDGRSVRVGRGRRPAAQRGHAQGGLRQCQPLRWRTWADA